VRLNQTQAIVAFDFFVAVPARFQVLCVFVTMEVGSRRNLHGNVSNHPTVPWTAHPFQGP
jgi:hypothetical protein